MAGGRRRASAAPCLGLIRSLARSFWRQNLSEEPPSILKLQAQHEPRGGPSSKSYTMYRYKYHPITQRHTQVQGATMRCHNHHPITGPVVKKRRIDVDLVKYSDVASATNTDISEILNQIEAAQEKGKRRIVITQTHDVDGTISSLVKVGFRVQRLTTRDTTQFVVHWSRGMVMFCTS